MEDKIARINELYHKSKNEGLTEEEKERFAQSCKTMDGNYQKALVL